MLGSDFRVGLILRKFFSVICSIGLIGCAHLDSHWDVGSSFLSREELSLADQKHYELSLYYIESGHYQIAREKLERLLQQYSSFPDLYNSLGVINERRGQVTAAIDYFLKAFRLNPNYHTAIKNYGVLMCYVEGGDGIISMAKNQSNTLVKSRLYSEGARCYIEEKKISQAEKALEKALQYDSHYADSYLLAAKLYFNLAQYPQAERALFRFNDLNGYTEESATLGLALAENQDRRADIDRYRSILIEQFKVSR